MALQALCRKMKSLRVHTSTMDAFIYVLIERMEMLESRLNQAYKAVYDSKHKIDKFRCYRCNITFIDDADHDENLICASCENYVWCDECFEIYLKNAHVCIKCYHWYCDNCIDSQNNIIRVDGKWL